MTAAFLLPPVGEQVITWAPALCATCASHCFIEVEVFFLLCPIMHLTCLIMERCDENQAEAHRDKKLGWGRFRSGGDAYKP